MTGSSMLKVMSFNVNGIRARPHQIEHLVNKHRPDILGLQETKVQDLEFPYKPLNDLGYEVLYFGQKGHYGVALMYRGLELEKYRFGLLNEDEHAQKRMIEADFKLSDGDSIKIFNGYFPNGENRSHAVKFPYKEKFYADFTTYLESLAQDSKFLVMGDMNIAPKDKDVGIGEKNMKRWLKSGHCSFLPEERGWYEKIMNLGMEDSYRLYAPEVSDKFSWFDYRSRGFDDNPRRGLRIDHILLSKGLISNAGKAGIDYEIRSMEKPSDHCPIWTELSF